MTQDTNPTLTKEEWNTFVSTGLRHLTRNCTGLWAHDSVIDIIQKISDNEQQILTALTEHPKLKEDYHRAELLIGKFAQENQKLKAENEELRNRLTTTTFECGDTQQELTQLRQLKQSIEDWLRTKDERFKQFCIEDKKLTEKYPWDEINETYGEKYYKELQEVSDKLNFGSPETILKRLLKESEKK